MDAFTAAPEPLRGRPHRSATRRRLVLLFALLAALPLALLLDPSRLVFSRFGALQLLRWWGVYGLVLLGQQAAARCGVHDLGAGALAALAAASAVGLAGVVGEAGGIAIAAGAVIAVGLGVAALSRAVALPPELVSLLPLLLVPAALPAWSAPPPASLERLAGLALAGWLPPVAIVCAAAAAAAAALEGQLPARAAWLPYAGFGLSAGHAALAGLWLAGSSGAATSVPLWPVGIGLGGALLLHAEERLEPLGAALLGALLALGLGLADLAAPLDPAGSERLRAVAAGALLTAGLWSRRRSAHAEDPERDRLIADPARVDQQADLEALRGADRDVPD